MRSCVISTKLSERERQLIDALAKRRGFSVPHLMRVLVLAELQWLAPTLPEELERAGDDLGPAEERRS